MAKKKSATGLNERAQHLLKVLVNQYIEQGQPVGSKTLAKAARLDISPATIRNIMSELEDQGYVKSPHTSAGRVPTTQGYRFFVDSLVEARPVGQKNLFDELKQQLDEDKSTHEMVASVSEFLSGVTHLAGIVTLPKADNITLMQIEFLPLSDRRVLAILVTSDKEVKNHILQVPREFKADELRVLSNYFNDQFAGMTLQQVRQTLLHQIRSDREHMDQLMNTAMDIAETLFTERQDSKDYVLAGEANLMGSDRLSNIDKLRNLFEAFNRKQEILSLLDQCIETHGVQIFIGSESGYQIFDECSVVTSSYTLDSRPLGVLGVIGPTRMQYDRVIPIVDVTSKVLAAVLNSRQ